MSIYRNQRRYDREAIYSTILEFNKHQARATVEITLRRKPKGIVLSICGTLFRYGSGGMSGQCIEEIHDEFPEETQRIYEVWKRWHLNDLHAGCIHQREYENEPYENHRGYHCDICDYTYGHGWQYEAIPDEIINEIKSWSQTDDLGFQSPRYRPLMPKHR